jgi:hypothetical protein
MSSPERLESLITAELVSIPTYLWGGFFPIHVALWRYLIEQQFGIRGPVNASKQSIVPHFPYILRIQGEKYELTRQNFPVAGKDDGGYVFNGPQTEQLKDILWRDGPILDSVEQLAYFVSDNTNRESFLTGHVSEKDLPPLDKNIIRVLTNELCTICSCSGDQEQNGV